VADCVEFKFINWLLVCITCCDNLKFGIVEPEEMAFARLQLDKHMSAVTDMHATIEELLEIMFSMWSMARLYVVCSKSFGTILL
jgi:hypothetical protein